MFLCLFLADLAHPPPSMPVKRGKIYPHLPSGPLKKPLKHTPHIPDDDAGRPGIQQFLQVVERHEEDELHLRKTSLANHQLAQSSADGTGRYRAQLNYSSPFIYSKYLPQYWDAYSSNDACYVTKTSL